MNSDQNPAFKHGVNEATVCLFNSDSVNFFGNKDITVSRILDGDIVFNKYGLSRIELTGNNTYTGRTIINSGTLAITSDANLGYSPIALVENNIVLNGGNLEVGTPSVKVVLDEHRGITVFGNPDIKEIRAYNVTFSSGSTRINIVNADTNTTLSSALAKGMLVTGAGIAADSFVTSIAEDKTYFYINKVTTSSKSNTTTAYLDFKLKINSISGNFDIDNINILAADSYVQLIAAPEIYIGNNTIQANTLVLSGAAITLDTTELNLIDSISVECATLIANNLDSSYLEFKSDIILESLAGETLTISAAIKGNGGFTKNQINEFIITDNALGNSTYSGNTNLNLGRVKIFNSQQPFGNSVVNINYTGTGGIYNAQQTATSAEIIFDGYCFLDNIININTAATVGTCNPEKPILIFGDENNSEIVLNGLLLFKERTAITGSYNLYTPLYTPAYDDWLNRTLFYANSPIYQPFKIKVQNNTSVTFNGDIKSTTNTLNNLHQIKTSWYITNSNSYTKYYGVKGTEPLSFNITETSSLKRIPYIEHPQLFSPKLEIETGTGSVVNMNGALEGYYTALAPYYPTATVPFDVNAASTTATKFYTPFSLTLKGEGKLNLNKQLFALNSTTYQNIDNFFQNAHYRHSELHLGSTDEILDSNTTKLIVLNSNQDIANIVLNNYGLIDLNGYNLICGNVTSNFLNLADAVQITNNKATVLAALSIKSACTIKNTIIGNNISLVAADNVIFEIGKPTEELEDYTPVFQSVDISDIKSLTIKNKSLNPKWDNFSFKRPSFAMGWGVPYWKNHRLGNPDDPYAYNPTDPLNKTRYVAPIAISDLADGKPYKSPKGGTLIINADYTYKYTNKFKYTNTADSIKPGGIWEYDSYRFLGDYVDYFTYWAYSSDGIKHLRVLELFFATADISKAGQTVTITGKLKGLEPIISIELLNGFNYSNCGFQLTNLPLKFKPQDIDQTINAAGNLLSNSIDFYTFNATTTRFNAYVQPNKLQLYYEGVGGVWIIPDFQRYSGYRIPYL